VRETTRINPIVSAHFSPDHSSGGDTLNENTTWLKLDPNVEAVKLSNTAHATPAPITPPSSASNSVSAMIERITGDPRNPMARSVAISRVRAATAAYMVLSAPNTAPTAMMTPTTVPRIRMMVEIVCDCAL